MVMIQPLGVVATIFLREGDIGNDSLYGGNGNDGLFGGSNQDTLKGQKRSPHWRQR